MEAPERRRPDESDAPRTPLSLVLLVPANTAKIAAFTRNSGSMWQSFSAGQTRWRREEDSNSWYPFCSVLWFPFVVIQS